MTSGEAPGTFRTQAIMDAGGEHGSPLHRLVTRRLTELGSGQILHIISLAPNTRLELPAWCRQRGHCLLAVQESDNETQFWIRKA